MPLQLGYASGLSVWCPSMPLLFLTSCECLGGKCYFTQGSVVLSVCLVSVPHIICHILWTSGSRSMSVYRRVHWIVRKSKWEIEAKVMSTSNNKNRMCDRWSIHVLNLCFQNPVWLNYLMYHLCVYFFQPNEDALQYVSDSSCSTPWTFDIMPVRYSMLKILVLVLYMQFYVNW